MSDIITEQATAAASGAAATERFRTKRREETAATGTGCCRIAAVAPIPEMPRRSK